MSDIWHLSQVDWLSHLGEQELGSLRAAAAQQEFARGDTIFAPSREPQSVFLLEHGLARIYRLSQDGAEVSLGFVQPGEVFGEMPAFGNYPRESFALAVEASRVWRIERKAFREFLRSRPDIVPVITRQVGERLKRIERRVEDLVFRDVGSRLASLLLDLAQTLGQPESDGTRIRLAITQSDLASLIGSTRQSVNAALGELEGSGAIRRDGRQLVVLSREVLAGRVRKAD